MADEIFVKNLNSLIGLFINTIDWLKSNGVETSLNTVILTFGHKMALNSSPHEQITNFIQKSYEYWPAIRDNDEKFLMENAEIFFEGVPLEYIKEVKRLLSEKDENGDFIIPETPTRKSIWKFLEALVKNSILYIHQYRCPDPITKKYKIAYFGVVRDMEGNKISEGISVRENAEFWGVVIK